MSNKTARSILEDLIADCITVTFTKFRDEDKKTLIHRKCGDTLADLYALLKLPEKKMCPETGDIDYGIELGRNQTIDECNAILKTKLEQ